MISATLHFDARPLRGLEPVDVVAAAGSAVDAVTILESCRDRAVGAGWTHVAIRFLALNPFEAALTARTAVRAARRLADVDAVDVDPPAPLTAAVSPVPLEGSG